jgi:LysM repeat protein
MERRRFLHLMARLGVGTALTGAAGRLWATGGTISHTVLPGETLSEIAVRYRTSVSAIQQMNQLPGDRIVVGQQLLIPVPSGSAHGAISHQVQSGETLSGIAQQYRVSLQALREANQLSGDLIVPGQILSIPSGSFPERPGRGTLAGVLAATARIRIDRSRWRFIVGHHSAVQRGNAQSYDSFHRRRGMENGLAYHFVIGNGVDSGDGEIEVGNRWLGQIQGGHVRNHQVNLSGIGICLVGNFEETRPTRAQMQSFIELVHWLRYDLLGGIPRFTVHREVDRNHTVCPGRHFPTSAMHRRFS